jgi:hypothetical protein
MPDGPATEFSGDQSEVQTADPEDRPDRIEDEAEQDQPGTEPPKVILSDAPGG